MNCVRDIDGSSTDISFRTIALACILTLTNVSPTTAGIDVNELRKISTSYVGGDLKAQLGIIQEQQKAQEIFDAQDVEFEKLKSGASFREYRAGRGAKAVRVGSTVEAEMTIRCKSFATAKDVGGVKYYDTKLDTTDGNLIWTIGDGSFVPAVEEAMIGMKRGAIRRVELPSTLVFSARKDNQLPLPRTEEGKRRFSKLFKTDATLLFEILVDKIEENLDTSSNPL
jgi:hypothetical protein